MKNLLHFTKRIHSFAGGILYLNLLGIVFISLFEGVGIFMLLPLISLTGLIDIPVEDSSVIYTISNMFDRLPDGFSLPLILLIYVLLMIGQAYFHRSQQILSGSIQQGFIRHLRNETYKSLIEANWGYFLRKRRSDIINVMTTELSRVAGGTQMFLQFIASLVFTAIQIGIALWLSFQMTAAVILFGAALVWFTRKFIRQSSSLGSETVELSKAFLGGITDHLNGIKEIKSNTLEHSHVGWVRTASERMEQNMNTLVKVRTTSQFIHKAVSAVLIAGFIYFSIQWFHAQAAQLMLILLIFSRLWPRVSGIQNNLEQLGSLLPSFRVLLEMQNESREAREMLSSDHADGERLVIKEKMECTNVFFRYEAAHQSYALEDITVQIPANRMTAIVGPSGAGKSTLVDLLMGLNQPEGGEVRIDGVPLTNDSLFALRRSIGYVAQDPFLFNGSVRENLLMVEPEASEAQLWEALDFAASSDFVRRLPEGLDTLIGDRGIKLSGGERQRLVLARAMLRRPSILVLDEATSALDTENEKKIQEALERLNGEVTIIVIAHRLSTIRNADQVIVLDQGKVVQAGDFHQLAEDHRGLFNSLLRNQMKVAQ